MIMLLAYPHFQYSNLENEHSNQVLYPVLTEWPGLVLSDNLNRVSRFDQHLIVMKEGPVRLGFDGDQYVCSMAQDRR